MYVTYITGQAACRSNNIGQSPLVLLSPLFAGGTNGKEKPSLQQWHKYSFI